MSISSGSRDYGRFDELAEEFAGRYRRGERPGLQEFVDRLPEMAEEIREMFPALVEVERVEGEARGDGSPTRPPSAVPHLKQVGDYRILREVGRGGMGVVYEAEQISLNRRVALKVLPGHMAGSSKALERFRREAKAAARLHHTNIVPVFEVGRDGEITFYAMQFILGQGLDQVIDELARVRDPARQPREPGPEGLERVGESAGSPSTPGDVPTALRMDGRSRVAGLLLSGRLAVEARETFASQAQIGDDPFDPAATSSLGSGSPVKVDPSPTPSPEGSSLAKMPGGTRVSGVDPSGRRLPFFRSVAQIGRQAAQGLAHAHARGVVHRDIKPSNLLLDTDGVVWITDFGLAKADDDGLTATGDILGTLRYMPPERFRGEGDGRADSYALGLTLYELLTLRPAYDSNDRLTLIERVKHEEPIRPRLLDARIPRDLETIVLKAIDKDPGRRYQSAEAMAEDLRRFLADEPIQARRTSVAERCARWAHRNPSIAVLGGVLAAVLLLATIGSLMAARRFALLAEDRRLAAAKERSARIEADQARDEAGTRERSERWERYRSNIAEASAAQQLQNSSSGARALEAAPEEYRNWEWRHLHGLLDAASLVLPVPGILGDTRDTMRLSPDARQIAVRNNRGEVHLFDAATGRPGPVLRGHSGAVHSLEYSPDGRQLASGGDDGTIRIWEPSTGRQQLVLRGEWRQHLHYSSDGKRIGSNEVSIEARKSRYRLWDASTGRELALLGEGPETPAGVAFSPDGKRVAAADGEFLHVHDAETGRRRSVLGPHQGPVNQIVFSPDGTRLLVTMTGGTPPVLRDGDSGEVVAILSEHSSPAAAVAFSPDGSRLAMSKGYPDNVVRLWETRRGKLILAMPGHTNAMLSLAFSPDGKRLASASLDQTGRLWDGETGREIAVLRGHLSQLSGMAFSPDGRRLVTASQDHTMRLWDAESGGLITVMRGHGSPVWSPVFTPDGARLFSSEEVGTVRVWDMTTAERNGVLRGHTNFVYDVAFRPDGAQVASSAWDGTARLWDPTTGRQTGLLHDESGIASAKGRSVESDIMAAVAYSPDGGRLATANRALGVSVWKVASGDREHNWPGITGLWNVNGRVAFSPDRTLVAGGSAAGPVRLWLVATGEHVADLIGHEGGSGDVAFAPDGATLASVGPDGTIRLWDVATRKPRDVLRGHTSRVYRVAYSRDGRQIASGSDDATVRLWDARSHAPLSTINIGSKVYGLAFSPDGTRLAVGCADTTVRLIDVATRQEVVGLRGHTDFVHAVAWSPDGTRLVSGSGDRTLRVWDSMSIEARARASQGEPSHRDDLIRRR